jgi:DNA-binding NarL/FixJ family response regulator
VGTMTARRVFVVWTHPIFRESVRLLLRHPGIEWVGATSDYAAAKDEILSVRPDTVLVEGIAGSMPTEVMEILEASLWNVRVIGLSLADNELSVYHREHRTVARGEELLRLVLSDWSRGESK